LYEQQAAEMAAEAGEPGAGDRVLGRMLVADFSGPRVLERVQLYERRIENSLLRARVEWDELHARPRRSDRKEGVTTKEAPSGQSQSGNSPGLAAAHSTRPTKDAPVNKQSQWQPPAVGGLGSDWTNKANFGDPIGVLGDLAAHKRLPARRTA